MSATTAIMGASAVMSLLGAFNQSKATNENASYQQSVYESNARMAEIQAMDAVKRGDTASKETQARAKRLIGSQRAALAAQGQDLETGSALQIQQDTAEIGAADALTIRNNAWREAWGYQSQAEQYRTQSIFSGMTASNNSGNTLLTGGLNAVKDIAIGYMSKSSKTVPKTA